MKIKFLSILIIFCLSNTCGLNAQLNGMLKTGLNVGDIEGNGEQIRPGILLKKPLIRPIIGIGAEYKFETWRIRQEIMFQVKGQGTKRPDSWSAFNTNSKDILRFMSFPFTIHRKTFRDLFIGIGIQPSLYLTGSDNYWAKEYWHGWIWSLIGNIHWELKEKFEIGFEYDYDLTDYVCPNCNIRFYTYRMYFTHHFNAP